MKLVYIEIEASAEDMKSNPSLTDTLRDALWRASRNIQPVSDFEQEEEDD